MSKIEKYREQSELTHKIICNLRYAQGLDSAGEKDPRNDKDVIDFHHHSIWDSDIPVWFHASYGYYGNSSGYSACFSEMQPYLIKALNHYKEDIVRYMMEQAEHDEHMALLKCKEEAEKILEEINGVMINKAE
jgi:hypothetical protein